uniref:Large ribosomal subunit protein uL14c n=1 Tax=Sciaphila thaidanica TaxID=2161793 RepID=A0A2R4PAJ8_9LILI|nr:ribosomal protein L14 [Sciaphila thaidanica]
MIQSYTLLNAADNSGAQKLMCINMRNGSIGSILVSVIKKSFLIFKKSEMLSTIIIRTRKEFKRKNGIIIKYDDNAVIVIDKKGNPKGSRIFGAIAQEFRKSSLSKIISLTNEII